MIVCTKCGFQNADTDSFCGSCGSFLEWTGQRVETAAPEEPAAGEPAPAQPGEGPGIVGRARRALGLDQDETAGDAAAAASGQAEAEPTDGGAQPTGSSVAPAAPPPAPIVVSRSRIVRPVARTSPDLVPPTAPADQTPTEVIEEIGLPGPAIEVEQTVTDEQPVTDERFAEAGPVTPVEPAAGLEVDGGSVAEPAAEANVGKAAEDSSAVVTEVAAASTAAAVTAPDAAAEPEPAPAAAPALGTAAAGGPAAVADATHEPGAVSAPGSTAEPAANPSAGSQPPNLAEPSVHGADPAAGASERVPLDEQTDEPTTELWPALTARTLHEPAPEPREASSGDRAIDSAPQSEPRVVLEPTPEPEPPARPSIAPAPPPAPLLRPMSPAASTPIFPPIVEPAPRPTPIPPVAPPPTPIPPMAPPPTGSAPAAPTVTPRWTPPEPAAVRPVVPVPPVQPAPVRPVVPVPPPAVAPPVQPPSVQPSAVQPTVERPRAVPRPVTTEPEAPQPGELVCGSCGTGNDPSRTFCRRCGSSLAAATVARPHVPWWRRIFGGGAAKPALAAGERPASMRRDASATGGRGVAGALKSLVPLILVALVAGAVTGYLLVPSVKHSINDFADQIRMTVAPNYVPVNTAGAATGVGIAGHPAQAAFDGFSNTYWAAPATEKAPSITARFSPPTDVAKVLVTPGDSKDYHAEPRPRSIRFDFLNATGTVIASTTTELQDSQSPQTIDVNAKAASGVQISVLTIFASNAGASVSITEVEFRVRR